MQVNTKEYKLANGKLRKIEDAFGHSYHHDQYGYCAGVTTVLSETLPTPFGLKEWYKLNDRYSIEKVFKEATDQGSKTHGYIEMLNLAQEVDLESENIETQKQVTSYIDWVRNWNPEQMQTEQVIFYKDENMQFAGTVDIIAMIDGKRYLIDIKTSNQVGISAYLQVAAYAEAYEASYGEKIEETLILQLGTSHKTLNTRKPILGKPSNGVGWKIHEHPKTFEDFRLTYQMWMMLQDGVYPEPPKVVEYATKVKLFEINQLHERMQQEAEDLLTGGTNDISS